MNRMVFINLPVNDLPRSKDFYVALGFSINEAYTNDDVACVVMGGGLHCMLHTPASFKRFTDKDICDATRSVEVLLSMQVETREAVDRMVAAALANGGSAPRPSADHGFMYLHPFEDLDGHCWEPIWLAEG